MTPELIAALASAVTDDDEWAIVLTGERRQGGYEVEVTGYHIPPQDRSGGHVSVKEFDLEADVVGVIHSHHSLGAFFSTTDTGTLNPRFPISIVVAHGADKYLGFDYKGIGKVTLPCGSTGEIEFRIQPTTGPVIAAVSQVTHQESDLGDCNRYVDAGDAWHVEYKASCGLSEPRALKQKAFGVETSLLDIVSKLDRSHAVYQGGTGKGMTQAQIKDDPDSHWCNQHKAWDFCEYNKKWERMSQTSWCNKHQRMDACKSTTASTQEVPTPTRTGKDEVDGGASESIQRAHMNVWMGYCEDCDADMEADPAALIAALIYCDDCCTHAAFADWSCENCGAPFCMSCDEGHSGVCEEDKVKDAIELGNGMHLI